jgi:hypothetical protein
LPISQELRDLSLVATLVLIPTFLLVLLTDTNDWPQPYKVRKAVTAAIEQPATEYMLNGIIPLSRHVYTTIIYVHIMALLSL